MYYYQFNIGDYASHANNLSLLEDLAYRRLLDAYYRDEGLEETCEQEIARDIGMKDYQDEVSYVLKKFFKKTKKGYKQEKADREIKAYHAKADAARANGKLGGRPKKTQEKPSGLADKTQSKANQEPRTNNHKPVTNIPYTSIEEAYNELFADKSGNSRIAKFTEKRKKLFKSAWNFDIDNEKENLRTNNIEYWKRYFGYCSEVKFFQADCKRSQDHENWKPDFDFIIKPDTQLKAREGKYQ